jgi:hypothetical protein
VEIHQTALRLLTLVVTVIGLAAPLHRGAAVTWPQFGAATNFPCVSWPEAVVAGDFNQDGKPDIVVASSGFASVLLSHGNGAFTAVTNKTLWAARWVATGDFNNDGNLDLLGVNN